jgi:hypothetical protein
MPRVTGVGSLIGLLFVAELGMVIWFYEIAAWLTVWTFVVAFTGMRAGVRVITDRHGRAQPDTDLRLQPEHIDLGRL